MGKKIYYIYDEIYYTLRDRKLNNNITIIIHTNICPCYFYEKQKKKSNDDEKWENKNLTSIKI